MTVTKDSHASDKHRCCQYLIYIFNVYQSSLNHTNKMLNYKIVIVRFGLNILYLPCLVMKIKYVLKPNPHSYL